MALEYITADDKIVCLPAGGVEADVPAALAAADQNLPLALTKAESKAEVTAVLNTYLESLQAPYPDGVRQTFTMQKAAADAYAVTGDLSSAEHLATLDALLQTGETRAQRKDRILAKATFFTTAALWGENARDAAHTAIDGAADEAGVTAALVAFRTAYASHPTPV